VIIQDLPPQFYIVYWQKEGSEKEIRIILPELYLKKPGTDTDEYIKESQG